MKYTITMAEVCKLAHTLTLQKLGEKAEKIIKKGNNVEVRYSKAGEELFNYYHDLIINTLGICRYQ